MLAPAAAPLIELPVWSMEQIDRAIADHVARLIPDRVTIELGLGAIPQAVTRALGRKRLSESIRGRSVTGSPI